MAPSCKPPDKCPAFLACHTGEQVEVVVCIICDGVFHTNCLNKISDNIKYVGKNLIICHNHSEKNITSKIEEDSLSESARTIIAQVKSMSSEEIRKDLLIETESKTSDLLNSELTISDSEVKFLKTEVSLLRRLITELTEKNDLLKEKLQRNLNTPSKMLSSYQNLCKKKYLRSRSKKRVIPKLT